MIPIFELKRQYEILKPRVDATLKRTLAHGMFTLGSEVEGFERDFARYIDTYHAVGVGSGTDALTLALRALNVGPGDEVIVPANAYPTVFGVALAGVSVRLVDCGEDGNIDIHDLSRVVSKKTKAIIAVHLYGHPADVIGIQTLCRTQKFHPVIVEDAAQAHGAELLEGSTWRHVGTIADIGCFSFYPSKNLGAYGDGGMVVTDHTSVDAKLRSLRMYGETSRYVSETVSGVSRLDELQASILRIKLQYLDQWNERRNQIAHFYRESLQQVGDIRIVIPENDISYESRSSNHLFVIRTKRRDAFMTFMRNQGIGTAIHYPIPIHLTKSFRYLGYRAGDFPNAETLSREVVSLPIYPELTDKEAEMVVKAVRKWFTA